MAEGTSFSLADEVLRVLEVADAPLWASEIAERVSANAGFHVDRRDVNRCLYGAKLRDKVQQQRGSKWALVGRSAANRAARSAPRTSAAQARPGTTPGATGAISRQAVTRQPPWDRFGRFISYYLDCVREDESEGAERFLSDEGKRYIPFPLTEEWSLSERDSIEVDLSGQWSSFAVELRKLGTSGALFYGYPLSVRWVDKSAKGWSGGLAVPVFLQTVDYELAGSTLTLTATDDPPRANPRFLQTIAPTAEERRALLDELGMTADEDETPENGLADLAIRLAQAAPGLEVVEEIDPTALAERPGIRTLEKGGVFNRAVLVLGERSKYTHGLEAELERLGNTATDDELSRSALALLFNEDSGPQATAKTGKHGLVDVVALNDEQREAVRAGMTEPMSVVTGPPGTGKSQVVITLLANAYLRGDSVLFSSRNNKAVNVVEQRLNQIAGFPLVVRAGTQSGERNLRAELIGFLTRLLSLSVTARERKQHTDAVETLRRLLEEREALWSRVEALRIARNKVDHLDRKLDAVQEKYDEDAWDAITESLWEVPFPDLETAVALAKKHAEPDSGLFAALSRLFTRRGDFATVDDVVASLELFEAALGKAPASLSDGGAPFASLEYLRTASGLRGDCRLAAQYVRQLDELKEADALEDLADSIADADDSIWDWGARELRAHCQLVPDRVTPSVRKALGEFRATLERLSGDRIGGKAYAQLAGQMQELFRKVTPILPTWCVTNLSARSTLPFAPGLFDLLVIDEASQCDIASALPLMFRAKRVVIIGDPQQLRHISQLDLQRDHQLQAKHELTKAKDMPFTFSANSLFDLGMSVTGTGRVVSLREHFRSHNDIIQFSNRQWYADTLQVCTDYRRLRPVPGQGNRSVVWTEVRGKVVRPRNGGALNEQEARAAVDELVRLLRDQGFDGTVGLVTPFRAQANRMRDLAFAELPQDVTDRAQLIVDTAHGFQGDERDVIIFSPCVGKGMPRGANYFMSKTGNLFNVALSRARSLLHVVGDLGACRSSDVQHMRAFAEYYDALSRDSVDLATEESVGPWEAPLKEALEGAGLRPMPQYAVHQYRLDLALVEDGLRLDIEVDGELYHKDWDGIRCRDDVLRDRRLRALGWHVKRFWVYQVRDDLEACVQEIIEKMEELRVCSRS